MCIIKVSGGFVKKIILLLVTVMSFISCDMICNSVYEERYGNQEFVCIDIGYIPVNISELFTFISNNITYEAEKMPYDYAQSALKTWELKTGDCEDFTILFMSLAYQFFNIEAEMLILRWEDLTRIRTIESGGRTNHVMARINGTIYSTQTGCAYEGIVRYSYPFNAIFKL